MRETAIIPEDWLTPQKKKSHWPPHFKESMLKLPVDPSWPVYSVEIRSIYGICIINFEYTLYFFNLVPSTSFFFRFLSKSQNEASKSSRD